MTAAMKTTCLLLALSLPAAAIGEKKVHEEKDGLVMIEAEATNSSLRKWKLRKDVEGYSGEGHIEFTGNNDAGGKPESPLKYQFTVNKEGDYRLFIRGHKNLPKGVEPDKCNDNYVRLEGTFEAGDGGAPLKTLKKDTKFFGGSDKGWGWAQKLDEGHKKMDAIYHLKPGETYTLVISGRSKNWNIDRIVLKHSSVADNKAKAN